MSPLKRLATAWRRHGPLGFTRLLGKNIRYYSGQLIYGSDTDSSEFDQARGTDTKTIREIGSLDIESDNARHAVRYQPSPYRLAKSTIHGLELDHSRYSFLDFGAGKGRVLLIAAELPFREVIGIEFSRELQKVASANISKTASDMIATAHIECVYADATAYSFPKSPLVCYLYNPFDKHVMQTVVKRLENSLKQCPRDVYVIYIDPNYREVFDTSDCWDVKEEGEFYVIFRTHAAALDALCH